MPMTLRSYLESHDVWASIAKLESFSFIGDDSLTIGAQTIIYYGDRTLFKAFENMDADTVAKLIVKLYGDKWSKIIVALNDDISLSADSTDNRKEVTETKGNKTDSTNTTNKVSAYNVDDLISDSGSDVELTENQTGEVIKTTTGGLNSLNSLFNNLSLLDKTNIINLAIKDVVNYLTLSVY